MSGKITSYAALVSPHTDDVLPAVDVHDTSMAATGTTKKVTISALVRQPWQFRPEDYGAKGDGKIFTDGVTASNTTFTSATAAFTSADTGKQIMINGGNGTGAAPVLTTITFVSATTVTLGSAAGASATGCAFVYGTDDTSAINQAVSAAAAYAVANNYMAEVLFKDKIYMSASLTQATSPAVVNSQIPVPYPAQNGLSRKLMITLRGAGKMAPAQYWESTAPNVQGSAIVSTLTAPSTQDATFLDQSVIGGPSGAAGFTGGFANTHLTVEDMSVWCAAFTNIKALDMQNLSGCHLEGYSSNIFAPANNSSGATSAHPYLADLPANSTFQNSHGIGIRFPANLNNDAVTFGSVAVEGYEVCVQSGEHLSGARLAALYGDVILRLDGGGAVHETSIRSVSAEVYNGGILVTGASGHNVRLNIGWDSETVGTPIYDISDANNNAYGTVRWYDNARTAPVVTGAANLQILNDRQARAVQGAPSYTLGTAFQNPWWLPVWVQLAGGTVTNVQIGPTSATATTSLATATPVTFRLPSGWWLNISGSVKPTTFNAVPD